MIDGGRRRCLLAAAAVAAGACAVRAGEAGFEAVTWPALLPPNWDPEKILAGLALDRMSDGDPEAQEAMKQVRALWDKAPANEALNQRRVRLSGFMVPIEFDARLIREFLLVPYFGACIHAPAPPANQVVHVVALKPMNVADRGTSAVTVSGVMQVRHSESELAVSTYRLAAELIQAYKP